MELKTELNKLKSYFGTDIPKFKEQYKLLKDNFTSEKDIAKIDEFVKMMISDSLTESKQELDEMKIRAKLILNKEIIPLSYISKNYFKKSKDWIYQRVNGNIVNGKPVSFTPEEVKILQIALKDISKKIDSVI